MSVNLSSLAGAGAQFFDNNGVPLAGGLIYTYLAGTTTPAATYTSSTGLTAHSNPIVLDAAGRIATGEIWLTSDVDYKFIVKTSVGVQLGSYDNIPSINDFTTINAKFADLANTTNPALGDALVGFRQSNSSGNAVGAVGRTVHQKLQESVSVKDFGAVGDGVADDTAAFQAAVDYMESTTLGGAVYIPLGTYKITSTISLDRSANATLGRVSLFGENQYGTRIVFSGSGSCFVIANAHSGSPEPNASYQNISDMTIIGPARAVNTFGITVNLGAFLRFNNLYLTGFDIGFYLQDVDQFYAEKITFRFNNEAIYSRENPVKGATSTRPNNHTYVSVTIGNNLRAGGSWYGGSDINFFGGDVEYNGSTNPLGYGLRFEDCGYQGGRGANIQGVYFEGNQGVADIELRAVTTNAYPILNAVHQISADFKRLNNPVYDSITHVYCDFYDPAIVGVQKVILIGCSFRTYNGYTGSLPVVKYIVTQPTLDTFFDLGSFYEREAEKPAFVQNLNKQDAVVTKLTDQTFTSGVAAQWLLDKIVAPNPLWTPTLTSNSIVINSTGTYTISAFLVLDTSTAGLKQLLIKKNSALIGYAETSSASDTICASSTFRFTAGDLVSFVYTQTTGADQDIIGGTFTTSQVNIVKVYG